MTQKQPSNYSSSGERLFEDGVRSVHARDHEKVSTQALQTKAAWISKWMGLRRGKFLPVLCPCDLFPNTSSMNSSTAIVLAQDKSQSLIQINGSLSTAVSERWIRALELQHKLHFILQHVYAHYHPCYTFDLGDGCDLKLQPNPFSWNFVGKQSKRFFNFHFSVHLYKRESK